MFIPAQAKFWETRLSLPVVAGALAQVVVSLLTPPTARSFEEVAEAMSRERQSIEGAIAAPI